MMTERKTLSLGENLVKKVRFAGTKTQDIGTYFKAYNEGCFDELHDSYEEFRLQNTIGVQVLSHEARTAHNLLFLLYLFLC